MQRLGSGMSRLPVPFLLMSRFLRLIRMACKPTPQLYGGSCVSRGTNLTSWCKFVPKQFAQHPTVNWRTQIQPQVCQIARLRHSRGPQVLPCPQVSRVHSS